MPLLRDRVRETTTTVGTGTITLGGAVTGYQSFNTAFTNGDTTYYVIQGGTEWEIGIGTIGAGTLARTTVLQSSNADALVPFSAGTKDVFCSYVADRAVTTSDAATLTNKTLDDYTNNIGANSTHFRIKASGTISKGQVVKATGFTPGENAIEVAVVTSATDLALGIAESALTTGQFGLAVVIGELFDVNTNGLSVGAIIYSNGTGGYTTTKPSSGTYQPLGWVVRANLNNGVIAVNIVAPLYVETSTNTANTAVLRDGSGNFAAGTLTLAGLSVDSPTLVVDAANDRVGVGTASPSNPFTVSSTNTNQVRIANPSATGNALQFVDSAWSAAITHNSGVLTFNTADVTAERMRITSAGNVGIGTTSPGARLTVNANAASTNNGIDILRNGYTARFRIGAQGTSADDFWLTNNYNPTTGAAESVEPANIRIAANNVIGFVTNAAARWTINNAGHFLAATDASFDIGASGANRPRDLYLSGNATVSGNTALKLSNPFSSYSLYDGLAVQVSNGSGVGIVSSSGAHNAYLAFGYGTTASQQYSVFVGRLGVDTMVLGTGNTVRTYLDASGNLGLGVTPSAWSTGKAVEVGQNGTALWSVSAVDAYLTQGAYFNTSFRYSHTGAGGVSAYQQASGTHKWYIAAGGTAGNAITFTQAMTLDASGNLLVGTATAPSASSVRSVLARAGSSYLQLTNTTSTGTGALIGIGSTGAIEFYTHTGTVGSEVYTQRWNISSSGHLLAATDASFDIGASGANRPRDLFLSRNLTVGGQISAVQTANVKFATMWPSSIQGLQIYGDCGPSGAHLRMTYPSVADWDVLVLSSGDLTIRPNNTERIRFTVAGNVGIGTTTPGAQLDVLGSTDYATVQLTRTKSTGDQRVAVLGQHYTNTEEAVLLTGMLSNSTSNRMFIGGASASYNSATSIEFYTGATNTSTSGTERLRVDNTTTAGQTALLLWDVDNGTLERVTVGAADSGGVGYKVLRIPN